MGISGYKRLLDIRYSKINNFRNRLQIIAEHHSERLLICPSNTISFGITLNHLCQNNNHDDESDMTYIKSIQKDISMFGSMLFHRCVSGTRVIPRGEYKAMDNNNNENQKQEFIGYGSSIDNYHSSYMTAACSIGITDEEIDCFFIRLHQTFDEYHKKYNNKKKMMIKTTTQDDEANKTISIQKEEEQEPEEQK